MNDYSTYDEGRRSKTSTYAYAMGIWRSTSTDHGGSCYWWLRSPGDSSKGAVRVYSNGCGNRDGYDIDNGEDGIRPALTLNLSSSNLYTYAGTVCSDGTEDEDAAPGSGGTDLNGAGGSGTSGTGSGTGITSDGSATKVTSIKITVKGKKGKAAKKFVVKAGKKLKLKATTTPAGAKVTWKSSNKKYATVNKKGVVKTKRAGKGRKVKITAMAADGSGKKKTVKIKIK